MAKRKRLERKDAAPAPAAQAPARSIAPQIAALVLFVLLALFAILRLRLIDLPLERDEGEYAYAGQLILQGIAPYKLVYNMKWPGTYAAYALIMALFGQTIAGIRVGLIVVTSLTALLLYFLTARLFGRVAGVVAAAAELILSFTVAAMGPYAHATHFVSLCAVAGFLLLTRGAGFNPPGGLKSAPRIFAAGALIMLAAIMKQPGMFFGIFAALLMIDPKREDAKPLRDTAALAGGAIAIGALTVGILAAAGVFAKFKFWTIDYARQYVSETTADEGWHLASGSFGSIWNYTQLIWLIAIAGAVLMFIDAESRRHWKVVAAMTLAGILSTTPGLYFRQHYFITLFPAAAMLNGVAVAAASRLTSKRAMIAGAYAVAFLITFAQQWPTWMLDPHVINYGLYKDSPFFEAIDVGQYLKDHTAPSDTIAVVGSEPEIYFYANRHSATGYIYTYPLVEKQAFAHRMQEEMIGEIERAKPKYLVTVSNHASWLTKPGADMTIFDWINKMAKSPEYVVDGVVDQAPGGSEETWGPDAARHQAKSRNMLVLFRRRDSAASR